MKISHFPDFLPDETVFSVASRYLDRMQFRTYSVVSRHYFGKRSKGILTDFPTNLEHLVEALSPYHMYTADMIIDQHTLFPFYAPFLPVGRAVTLRKCMKISGNSSPHSIAGLVGSKVPRPQWLRYCSACVNHDRITHGECYWHRLHQVPGVLVCPIHETMLEISNVNMLYGSDFIQYCSAEYAISNLPSRVIPPHHHAPLIRLAQNAKWMLEHSITVEQGYIQQQYLGLLAEQGLVTVNGQVRYIQLKEAILDYYPTNLLEVLECKIVQSRQSWLVNQTLAQHPLSHLLFIQFLCGTAQEFFTKPRRSSSHPFGTGPWPCLNPLCPNYKKPAIRSYSVRQRNPSQLVATFTCHCGFIYSRTGPDIDDEAIFCIGRVLQYGSIWDQHLINYWSDSSISTSEIAHLMHVGVKTICRQAARLGLPFSPNIARRGQRPKIYQDYIDEQRGLYRDLWEDELKNHPNARISQLVKKLKKIYSWLQEHDKDWLKEHLPIIANTSSEKETLLIYNINRVHNNYSLVDADLATLVRKVAEEVYAEVDFPIRVTRRLLISQIEHYGCLQSPTMASKFLPLTANVLIEVVETSTAFVWRKLRWTVRNWLAEQTFLSYNTFRNQAHIDTHASRYPYIKPLIYIAYNTLKNGSLLSEQVPEVHMEIENGLVSKGANSKIITPGSLADICINKQIIRSDIVKNANCQAYDNLIPILLLTVAAIVDGAETCHAVTIWGFKNEALLYHFGLSKGYFPTYYVLRRIYAKVDIRSFEDNLALWLRDTFPAIQNNISQTLEHYKHIYVPGICLLRSYRHIASEVVAKLC